MGTGNHVDANQLSHTSCGGRSCVSCRFYRTDVPAYEDRDKTGADVFLADQLNVRSFDHRVSRFNGSDKAFGFNHSQCFETHQ
jgi:hypothetical protein